jgi:hypothetical protein
LNKKENFDYSPKQVYVPKKDDIVSAIRLAEKYFDRFDSNSFLDMLPHDTPLILFSKYLTIVIEFADNRKKYLQVSKI